MASFVIQIACFEFKLKLWTNQEATHHYRSSVPTAIGTNRAGTSAGDTDRPEQLVSLQTTWDASSPPSCSIDHASVGISGHWNQPSPSVYGVVVNEECACASV
jgi:hypothetical protein